MPITCKYHLSCTYNPWPHTYGLYKKPPMTFQEIVHYQNIKHQNRMDNTKNTCTCTKDGYAPDCPEAFYQGGRLLHSIGAETRLKPRIFDGIEREGKHDPRLFGNNDSMTNANHEPEDRLVELTPNEITRNGKMDENAKLASDLIRNRSTTSEFMRGKMIDDEKKMICQGDDVAYMDILESFPKGLSLDKMSAKFGSKTQMMDADLMVEGNRVPLRKYESLKIGNQELTDLSIGGFQVDLAKAAQKASMVAPLPPSKLPRIYIDSDMNFLHHFFQGLERLIGRERVLSIVNQDRYYTTAELILLPLIEEIVKVGYERKDTNLTVFTKSVLSSTFECDDRSGPDQDQRGLIVAANLWGFQYIECGMELKEADLRMWLSISYNHFRTMFFNTFKDSGMPAFAMEGVQARYEAAPERKVDLSERAVAISGPSYREIVYQGQYNDQDDDVRSTRSKHRRRSRKPEPTIGALLFGRGGR